MGTMTILVSVKMPPRTKKKLAALKQQTGLTCGQIVRELIEQATPSHLSALKLGERQAEREPVAAV